jgi:hypothetical protein
VSEQRSSPAPAVQETPGKNGSSGQAYDRYYPQPMPPASGSSLRGPPPRPAPPPPAVKLDQIVAVPVPTIRGQVVRDNKAPVGGARVMFVHSAKAGPMQSVTADAAGEFRVTLTSGAWLVYLVGADGRTTFHSKIDLHDSENRQVVLLTR